MIVCANCAHPNPDGATQCEACYTPLSQVPPTVVNAPPPEFENTSDNILPLPMGGDPASGVLPMPPAANAASTFQLDASPAEPSSTAAKLIAPKTQLQQFSARLLHTQSDTVLELPTHVAVIHIGKPNDRIPPDIDVSGFANSDIVSRIHADIRVEGDAYYIEDVGSSNGTYINNLPLLPGNRHRLRAGDRIALGKGDRVSFLFQVSN